MFDKDVHKFSIYAKFLAMQLPKGSGEKVYVDDKVLLEYYRLEKDFEGTIELEATEEGFRPIVIRQIKRCLFRQIKTGLSEHLTME